MRDYRERKKAELVQKDRKLSELENNVKTLLEVRNLDVFGKKNPETGFFPGEGLKQVFEKLRELTPEQREKAKMFIEHLKKLEEDKEQLQILEENKQILEKINNCSVVAKIKKEQSK